MAIAARWHVPLLALLCLAAYWNSQQGVFLLDDFASIHQNESIRALWPISGPLTPPNRGESVSGRPVVNLSLAANYAAGGLEVRGYHLLNIGIHLLCALLVMAIVRRLLEARSIADRSASRHIALVCAAIWMVHPLQSEAVTYIVARTESLMALWYLLAVYASIRAHADANRSWPALAVAACAIGMACKESMVTAPVAILLIDRAVFFDSFADAFKRRRGFYAGLAMSWIVLIALSASSPRANSAGFFIREDAADGLSPATYLLNQAEIIPHYLRLLIVPIGLVLDYGPAKPILIGEVIPGLLLIATMIIAAAWMWRRKPVLALPLALVLLTLAPTTFVPILTEAGAERRMYLPAIALISGAAVVLWRAGVKGSGAFVTSALLIAALTMVTIARNAEYHSSYGLWQTVVERRPHGRAHLNLAVEAESIGRSDEVLPLLRKAVVDFPDAEYPLGDRLYKAGAYQEAIEHLERFQHLRPGHFQGEAAKRTLIQSWTDLGIARANAGNLRGAIEAFQRAVSLDPSNPDLQRNLATAHADAAQRR
jgi:Flp pilus assembly protein TadD